MLQSKLLSLGAIGFVLSFCGPAVWADTTSTARPGTINYIEGQVGIGPKSLLSGDMGKTELAPGQVLQTRSGKAEILLTPGTFLRVASNSAVRMISPGLTDTRVQVLDGRAMVESTALSKTSDVRIASNGAQTQILKDGVYEFDADSSKVKVFDGKAEVYADDQKVELKKGREAQLTSAPLKSEKFDRKAEEDDLYKWSSARSEYMARANEASVRAYAVNPVSPWYGSRWYWNPWFHTWSFMPSDGLFYSPFGYGFYSPRYYYAPRPVIIVPRRSVIVPRAGAPAFRGGAHFGGAHVRGR
jgi:hypothetical protein